MCDFCCRNSKCIQQNNEAHTVMTGLRESTEALQLLHHHHLFVSTSLFIRRHESTYRFPDCDGSQLPERGLSLHRRQAGWLWRRKVGINSSVPKAISQVLFAKIIFEINSLNFLLANLSILQVSNQVSSFLVPAAPCGGSSHWPTPPELCAFCQVT